MDIFNRPPAIAEDTLQYSLYPPKDLSNKSAVTTFATCIHAFIKILLPPDFIWHRDPFELKVVADLDSGNKDAWMLEGRMRVGDCVDDEWCVVWLLREISTKWDLVISVYDSDGEFLLIEAAESLPSWVKPTNSENRVWIHNSHIHLIPISYVSPPSRVPRRRRQLPSGDESDGEPDDEGDEFLCIKDALTLVRDQQVDTLAPVAVGNIVAARISGYPNTAQKHVHTTKAYLPMDIARSLASNPSLIQKPIETFYTRDAIQLRAAHRMTRFPPQPDVLRTVRMTRTAYAQLVGQKFFPPKIFGRWEEREDSKEWRWRDVGMKIACGFEMLYQESKGRSETTTATTANMSSTDAVAASATALKDALSRNPDYVTYIQNLNSAGYFRGELTGSQLYIQLETEAAKTFVEVHKADDTSRQSFASQVVAAIVESVDSAIEPSTQNEDSDDWLNIDAEDFDAMLQETLRKGKEKGKADAMEVDDKNEQETMEGRLVNSQAEKLQSLAKKVEQFVEGEGGMGGAMFEDEELSGSENGEDNREEDGEMFTSEDEDEDDEESGDEQSELRRQEATDKLVPGLEPTEYGQMPASFHGNSQKVAPPATDVETTPPPTTQEPASERLGESPSSSNPPKTSPERPSRKPLLPRDNFDGVDSDDETDSDEATPFGGNDDGEESEEDRPQVVGEIEIDMGQEEDEFLEFSRQALGITDAQWGDIVRERRQRGAFVPAGINVDDFSQSRDRKSGSEPLVSDKKTKHRDPIPGPRPNPNSNLDSFEAVMQAMETELSNSSRKTTTKTTPKKNNTSSSASNTKGKGKAVLEDEVTDDGLEAEMDAELKAILRRGGDGEDDDDGFGGDAGIDYNLIKNFLESFKSQGGLSGPVGNLAGRLQPDFKLPRDNS